MSLLFTKQYEIRGGGAGLRVPHITSTRSIKRRLRTLCPRRRSTGRPGNRSLQRYTHLVTQHRNVKQPAGTEGYPALLSIRSSTRVYSFVTSAGDIRRPRTSDPRITVRTLPRCSRTKKEKKKKKRWYRTKTTKQKRTCVTPHATQPSTLRRVTWRSVSTPKQELERANRFPPFLERKLLSECAGIDDRNVHDRSPCRLRRRGRCSLTCYSSVLDRAAAPSSVGTQERDTAHPPSHIIPQGP